MSATMNHINSSLNHDWVRGQAECFIPTLFTTLAKRVLRDVEEAGDWSPLLGRGFQFILSPPIDAIRGRFTVVRKSPPNSMILDSAVEFIRNDESIRVDCHQGGCFRITAHWNPETGNCDLRIDGKLLADEKPYAIWQISQKALSSLIFPRPDDPVMRAQF